MEALSSGSPPMECSTNVKFGTTNTNGIKTSFPVKLHGDR